MKKIVLVVLVSILGTAFSAQAKELSSRLGVGIKESSSIGLPQLAASYYFAPDMSIAGGIGVDTEEDNSRFAFDVGIRRIVFKEDNMNFYLGGNVGLINVENNGNKDSGFALSALFGGEFFFTGLDSLAFTFEGGVGIVSMDNVRFRTIADNPFKAGIIFYF